jgi:hypothetical protein
VPLPLKENPYRPWQAGAQMYARTQMGIKLNTFLKKYLFSSYNPGIKTPLFASIGFLTRHQIP